MKKKKGRPQKIHKPVPASFDEVLGAFARSDYKDEKKIKQKKK